MQAEALMSNTDWKHSSAELRRLNEEWKKTGPVGAKVSDKIWHRFRTACDAFFQNKRDHFSELTNNTKKIITIKYSCLSVLNNINRGKTKKKF